MVHDGQQGYLFNYTYIVTKLKQLYRVKLDYKAPSHKHISREQKQTSIQWWLYSEDRFLYSRTIDIHVNRPSEGIFVNLSVRDVAEFAGISKNFKESCSHVMSRHLRLREVAWCLIQDTSVKIAYCEKKYNNNKRSWGKKRKSKWKRKREKKERKSKKKERSKRKRKRKKKLKEKRKQTKTKTKKENEKDKEKEKGKGKKKEIKAKTKTKIGPQSEDMGTVLDSRTSGYSLFCESCPYLHLVPEPRSFWYIICCMRTGVHTHIKYILNSATC